MTGKEINPEGVFLNYRQSKSVVHHKHSIIKFSGIDSRKSAFILIGRSVEWESSSGKKLKGKITRVHGKKGCVSANFQKAGLPGQAIGQKIVLLK